MRHWAFILWPEEESLAFPIIKMRVEGNPEMQQLTQDQDVTVDYQESDPVRNQHTQKIKAISLFAGINSTAHLILLCLHNLGSITAFCKPSTSLLPINQGFSAHSYGLHVAELVIWLWDSWR